MAKERTMLWKKGMVLQPGHFYLSENLIVQAQTARWRMHDPFYYGVTEICVDDSALANGWLTIISCTGVLDDGTPFAISDRMDKSPPSRSFANVFSHDKQTCDVYIGLPFDSRIGCDPSTEEPQDRQQKRYHPKVVEAADGKDRDIESSSGVYNFSILFSGESIDGYSKIKVATLSRNANGKVILQEEYVPPLLSISGSTKLLANLERLIGMLLARSAALSQGRKQKSDGTATFSSTAQTAFKLLETINTYTPLINYYHVTKFAHPFELFKHLTQFAGALTVFSSDAALTDLVKYDHDNLAGTFGGLIGMIRTILETDIDADCVVIPYEKINEATYLCKLANQRLLASARFYLGVSANVPEKELIIGVAQRIKMSSRDRLDVLIASAMPGIPLVHTPRPPDKLSTKPGFLYFVLDRQSQFWNGIQSSGTIAFYFPNQFSGLKLEMLALLD